MKLVAYQGETEIMVGEVSDGGEVRALGSREAFWAGVAAGMPAEPGAVAGNLADLRQRPPVPAAARVICIGLNYRRHAEETGSPIPETPVVFGRWVDTLVCDGDPVPAMDDKFDWEVELGVVVGRTMHRVDQDAAAAGIFGYFAFNDLSARGYQMETAQWTLGKNTDASGPMSAIVTADDVGDPASPGLRLVTKVNGVVKQDSTTSDMIFTVPRLIAHLSRSMTLRPGDVIVTGTPEGVGLAGGEFLKPGDVVEVEIEKIGRVSTPIVAPPAATHGTSV